MKAQAANKTLLFETMPIPKAVANLAVPTILSSLVMVLYNLADTYFVGMLNDPLQNAAVTLAAPVLLAFNAVNNLFGVGTSSMMSRALGRREYDMVRRSSAMGFYCALFCGALFAMLCTLGKGPLLVLLEDLQDPGNLGTILRTGEGAGITGVIMSKKTVDIFNPKTIRATMGSIYRVPFLYVEDLGETVEMLRERGIRVYAAHLQGQTYYSSFSFTGGTAFLIGNEGNGLRRETAEQADSYLKIPMEGRVESLNAAIAASLLVYEAHRQRNAGTAGSSGM